MKRASFVPGTDAASPVVGVLLMVTVTVVCSTVVGTLALGLSGQAQGSTPDVDVGFVYDEGAETLTVVHEGGEAFPESQVAFAGDVAGGTEMCVEGQWTAEGKRVTPGDTCEVLGVGTVHNVSVVWMGDDGTTRLATWTDADTATSR